MNNKNWILKAFLLTFIIALFFNSISNILTNKIYNIYLLIIIDILFVFIGIIFDLIGTACLTADEATFHSMSAKKIKGAKTAVNIIKNNTTYASICNDVIGDICGIVSGSVSAMIGLLLAIELNISSIITILVISSIISSLTVGGKAIGKKIAIKKADNIVFKLAKCLEPFKKSN